MADITSVKFYKSTGNTGGFITTTQIMDATFNNFFGNVSRDDQVSGEDYYQCMYVKNTHDVDAMDNFNFWLDTDSLPDDTTIKWALDAAGKNGTAQVVANIRTAPTSVTWRAMSGEPATPTIGKLEPRAYYPVWVWWHVEPNAVSRMDDFAAFNFTFLIPAGAGGGGTGGVAQFDQFGVLKIYPTIAGGREWFSTLWNNGHSRVLDELDTDPDDPNLAYSDGTPLAPLTIGGAGIANASVESTSYRVYNYGPWLNTETTCYVKINGNNTVRSNSPPTTAPAGGGARNIQIHSRSSHSLAGSGNFAIPLCHFGGYVVLWDRDTGTVEVQCEILDHIIDRHLGEATQPGTIPRLTWIGFKNVTRTIANNNIKVEGYVNYTVADQNAWQKCVEYEFNGANTDFDVLHNPADPNHDVYQCCKYIHEGGSESDPISECSTVTEVDKDDTVVASDLVGKSRWRSEEKMCWVRTDDTEDVDFKFFSTREIDPLANPNTTGGGGGPAPKDQFGIRQIYDTATGGRVYYSNWHLPGTTTHTWDATGGQVPGVNLDPQDSFADLVAPSTCRAIVDAATDTLTADTNTDHNSWRYYIKDPLDNETTSTWKWSESVEVTVYYKAISDMPAGSIHVHCRLMGPGEHWNAVPDDNPDACKAAGHEYSYEIKQSGVNQFRKEEFHDSVANGEGYATDVIFPDTAAPYNKWIGMKLCTQKKGSSMKVQAYKDLTDGANGGTWVKAGEILDDGTNWKIATAAGVTNYGTISAGSGNCVKVSPIDAALTMDGSAVGIRVDNTKVQFKKFSCREIDPEDEGSGGTPDPDPDPDPGGGGTQPPIAEWKMAFVGDEGCGSTTDKVRDLCKTYDYTVSVGDHAYASASCWTSTFQSLKPKFNGAYGNHEYSESGGIAPYKTFFGHSKTYFSFNFQNVHIVVIDSNIDMDPGGAQHDFVKNDLVAASGNNSIDWIFAVLHHPMFGASSTHSYNDGMSVEAFHSLFMEHKVAFVFTGHNHNWQRTNKVAYNAGSPENPTNADTSSPFVNDTAGFIHVVTGTGGHDSGGGLYGLGSQPSFQGYQNRTHNGVYEIIASNNGKTLTCSFVDKDGTSKFDTITYTAT